MTKSSHVCGFFSFEPHNLDRQISENATDGPESTYRGLNHLSCIQLWWLPSMLSMTLQRRLSRVHSSEPTHQRPFLRIDSSETTPQGSLLRDHVSGVHSSETMPRGSLLRDHASGFTPQKQFLRIHSSETTPQGLLLRDQSLEFTPRKPLLRDHSAEFSPQYRARKSL